MDKLLKNKKNRAFTLVEILIVVIIIGILAGLMALSAGSSTETAEKTACRGDQRTVKSAYYVERAENKNSFKTSIENAMAQFPKAQKVSTGDGAAFYRGICHAGGEYLMVQDIADTNGKLAIMCTVEGHNGDDQLTALERLQLWSNIINGMMSSGLKGAGLVNTLNKIFGTNLDSSKYFGSNDDIRKLLQEGKFGQIAVAVEKDSALYKALKDSSMKTAEPYIQPYFKENKTIYWIAENGTNHAQWKAYALYYDGKWYQRTDGSTVNMATFTNQSIESGLKGSDIGLLNDDGSINTSLWKTIG